jgi:hypothetical protein
MRPFRTTRGSRNNARGQAMVETTLLTGLMVLWGVSMTRFWPDTMNALQIYMDSFYFLLSLPVP